MLIFLKKIQNIIEFYKVTRSTFVFENSHVKLAKVTDVYHIINYKNSL